MKKSRHRLKEERQIGRLAPPTWTPRLQELTQSLPLVSSRSLLTSKQLRNWMRSHQILILLIWLDPRELSLLVPQEIDWRKALPSTKVSWSWVRSFPHSQRKPKARRQPLHSVSPSWLSSFKMPSAVTRRQAWLQLCHRPTSTTTRHWVLCVTHGRSRPSRTLPKSMKIHRRSWSESWEKSWRISGSKVEVVKEVEAAASLQKWRRKWRSNDSCWNKCRKKRTNSKRNSPNNKESWRRRRQRWKCSRPSPTWKTSMPIHRWPACSKKPSEKDRMLLVRHQKNSRQTSRSVAWALPTAIASSPTTLNRVKHRFIQTPKTPTSSR